MTSTVHEADLQTGILRPWKIVVWDDPVNLMSYVTHVFMQVFAYPKEVAERLMLQVHNDGKSIVADRKSTRLNSSHMSESRMPSSA